MAEIYRARYTGAAGVTKPVVIKKILPHYAGNRNFVSMFINEAKIAVGLSHGNIAQVFDFGEIDGEYFLAMEYVHGQPLSRVLKRARQKGIPVLPTPYAVMIAIELCKGLHYAHTRLDEHGNPLNIIHRDVSPQNVIVSYEGQVKIVDFGIAKAKIAVQREQTEAGAVKGKYVYFSPEQAKGKDLDARTDIFAAGVVLYECVCGRLPFEGRMIEVLAKIVRGEFHRPRELNPDITPALERIILTAMAHERNDRYATAEAFQEALAAYLYTHAPTFSASSLAHFMTYLFEPELVAEGRPIQLPRDFLDQVPLWQKVLPPASDAPKRTSADRPRRWQSLPGPEDDTESEHSDPRTSQVLAPPWAKRWRAAFVLAPLLAAVLAAAVVVGVGHFGTFAIRLTSAPPGAEVLVDGQRAGQVTPLLIADLSARERHRIEVRAPGMRPWVREVEPQRGKTIDLHATLTPIPRPPERPALPAAPPPVTMDAHYPTGRIEIRADRHAFAVPATGAARIRLDPTKTYRLWTEGRIFLGGPNNPYTNDVLYFIEGVAVAASDTFGVLGPRPTSVRGASAVYAFVLDNAPNDNAGTIRLRIQEKTAPSAATLLVDGREHAVVLERHQRFALTDLDERATYEVTVKDGETPAYTRGSNGGRVGKVVLAQSLGPTSIGNETKQAPYRVLEVGRRHTVTGASWLQLSIPDDSLSDKGGSLQVTVVPAMGEARPTGTTSR